MIYIAYMVLRLIQLRLKLGADPYIRRSVYSLIRIIYIRCISFMFVDTIGHTIPSPW